MFYIVNFLEDDFNWGEMKNVFEVYSVCYVISFFVVGIVVCEIMVSIFVELVFLV